MAKNRLVLLLAAAPLLIGGLGFAISSKAVATQAGLMAQNSSLQSGQQGAREQKHAEFDQLLGLTDAQKAQLKQIHESTRQQMDAVFTAEQKAQLQQARQQKQRPLLNLTDAQKAQIKAIRDNAKSQMDAVLTDQQKQQLQQLHQQRMQNRQPK